jgi:hypothetical protein
MPTQSIDGSVPAFDVRRENTAHAAGCSRLLGLRASGQSGRRNDFLRNRLDFGPANRKTEVILKLVANQVRQLRLRANAPM